MTHSFLILAQQMFKVMFHSITYLFFFWGPDIIAAALNDAGGKSADHSGMPAALDFTNLTVHVCKRHSRCADMGL